MTRVAEINSYYRRRKSSGIIEITILFACFVLTFFSLFSKRLLAMTNTTDYTISNDVYVIKLTLLFGITSILFDSFFLILSEDLQLSPVCIYRSIILYTYKTTNEQNDRKSEIPCYKNPILKSV